MLPGPVNLLLLAFKNLFMGQAVQIHSLSQHHPYPELGGRWIVSKYGPAVMFNLRSEGDINLRIYLPKMYADVVDDVDIDHINLGRKLYKLRYLGMSGPAYLLGMEL